MVLLRIGSADQARRSFDKALELNPSLESAQEGIRISGDRQHREEVAGYAAKVLEAEARKGKEITKEDAFRECDVPYSHLDEVFAFLEEREIINLDALTPKEMEEFEDASRTVLLAAYRSPGVAEHGLRLPDVMANLHGADVIAAKKVLAYIEKVNELKFSPEKPDAETERQLRKVMNLSEDQRSAVGIMQHLGVGIYQARKLMAYADSFRGGRKGYKAPKVKVKELHDETPEAVLGEVPSEDLVERATQKAEAEVVEEGPSPRKRQPTPYEAPDLYSRFYKDEQRAEERTKAVESEDLKGRRCLFHGGIAVMKCASCGSMLCKECTASGACPRCKADLGLPAAPKKKHHVTEEKKELEDEELEPEELQGEARSSEPREAQPKDWSRL
jgi:hypothetical protein